MNSQTRNEDWLSQADNVEDALGISLGKAMPTMPKKYSANQDVFGNPSDVIDVTEYEEVEEQVYQIIDVEAMKTLSQESAQKLVEEDSSVDKTDMIIDPSFEALLLSEYKNAMAQYDVAINKMMDDVVRDGTPPRTFEVYGNLVSQKVSALKDMQELRFKKKTTQLSEQRLQLDKTKADNALQIATKRAELANNVTPPTEVGDGSRIMMTATTMAEMARELLKGKTDISEIPNANVVG